MRSRDFRLNFVFRKEQGCSQTYTILFLYSEIDDVANVSIGISKIGLFVYCRVFSLEGCESSLIQQ